MTYNKYKQAMIKSWRSLTLIKEDSSICRYHLDSENFGEALKMASAMEKSIEILKESLKEAAISLRKEIEDQSDD